MLQMVVGAENDGRVGSGKEELSGGGAAYQLDGVCRHIAQWGEEVGGQDGPVKTVEYFIWKGGSFHQQGDDEDSSEE